MGDLSAISKALHARGPDELFALERPDYSVVVSRLAIYASEVSVEAANAPSNNVTIAFNGEIWNVDDLRSSLGIGTRTLDEIELLRELYVRLGVEMFERIDGMFAVVIIDSKKRRLIAARDHAGIKPLFYGLAEGVLRLGSSLEALVALGTAPEMNSDFVLNMSRFGFSGYEDSFLSGVHQTPPGHVLEANFDSPTALSIRRWGTDPLCEYESFRDAMIRSVNDSISHLDGHRVGLLLSGGIDSTLLAATIRDLKPTKEIVALTLKDRGDEDWKRARETAQELGIPQILLDLRDESTQSHISASTHSMSGYYFAGIHAMFHSIRKTLPDLRVVLCGEGSDELFGGYAWMREPNKYLASFEKGGRDRDIPTALADQLHAYARTPGCALRRALNLDCTYPLVDRHLVPLDQGSMSASIELRVPFLHRRVWESANRMELTDRVGPSGKAPVRSLLLSTGLSSPEDILARPKLGMPSAFGSIVPEAARWARQVPMDLDVVRLQRQRPVLSRYAGAWYSEAIRSYRSVFAEAQG